MPSPVDRITVLQKDCNSKPLLQRFSILYSYRRSSGMESPRDLSTIPARSSVMDSIRGCGFSGFRIDKQDLWRNCVIPRDLRKCMRDCIDFRDVCCADSFVGDDDTAPARPLVVFINSRSGGRHGPDLISRLRELISEEQVFDLQHVKPGEFVEYGLGCLERLGSLGNDCASEIRRRLRVVVAGGDGTVGWILGSFMELYKQNRGPIPPTAIIPLGTGNDLARSFGWGGSFPFVWKSAVKRSLSRASNGRICNLDSWQLLISTPSTDDVIDLPHSLKRIEGFEIDQGLNPGGFLPEKVSGYEGVFYNYFSIGMDAQVAYGFHHLRNEKPYLAQGPIANKMIYSGYSCTQGWFFTPCTGDPSLRGLKNILKMHVRMMDSGEWKEVRIPKSVRAIVALNLHNYGSGRNPWGNLKQEYLEKRGFREALADDGLVEIFGLKQGWHATCVMVELISAKHISQASAIRLEMRGGGWKEAYMQMDGEPWKHRMSENYSTFVEIERVPHPSFIIHAN